MIAFLKVNGFRLNCTQAEETAMVMQVAAGEIGEPAWTEWVVRVTAQL